MTTGFMDGRNGLTIERLRSAYPTVNIGQALNLLPDWNAVFVTNPKAGCTSVKLMLQRVHLDDVAYDPGVRGIHDVQRLPLPSQLGWPKVMAMLDGAAYRFTFVRDPVARALSAYRDKIVNSAAQFAPAFRQALGRPENDCDPVTLDDFVTVIERQRPEDMDQHWRPQHINIMHDMITYDAIGRIERFAEDWARICGAIGLPETGLPHVNRTADTEAPVIDPSLRLRLERLYARDFDLFGY